MARPNWYSDHPSGGGSFHVLLLLTAMALAAATGWFIGDDELRGRVGDWREEWFAGASDWWEEQTANRTVSRTTQPQTSPLPSEGAQASSYSSPSGSVPAPEGGDLSVAPHLRHWELKEYMLELINIERARAGAGAVTLGDNDAAQLHAESSLENCVSSHWGVNGLKPYIRYSLAGGYQSNGENGRGLDYCVSAGDWVQSLDSLEHEVADAMRGWMGSPGHRRNILEPTHRKVNIGLAWDRYNIVAFQHFEGDYLDYSMFPAISNGTLIISGTLKNGAVVQNEDDLGIQIYYDSPPHPLTRGQLSRTYCYDGGLLAASLRPPLTGGWFYDTHRFSQQFEPCPDPYDVPADAPPPRSPDEANQHHREAKAMSEVLPPETRTVPWITAGAWVASDKSFEVRADINNILGQFGPGVYTIVVWARLMGDDEVVSEYSIFHGVTPPTGYGG